MLLRFAEEMVRCSKFDLEARLLADRHYSRQKPGTNQFMPPGRTVILRSHEGDVVFGWLWQLKRDDGQAGYNCSIFRNESKRLSSEIILEAEDRVISEWGQNRGFTYINPKMIDNKVNPGYCFKVAGWNFVKRTASGLHLLEKNRLGLKG